MPLSPAVLTVHVVGVGVFKFVHRLDTLWLLCRTACGVSFLNLMFTKVMQCADLINQTSSSD